MRKRRQQKRPAPVSAGPVDLDQTITIVSGLPRSGTSMMMRMLEAGGLPALTDGRRAPDEDNPRGYYEFEAVKCLKEDPSWLPRAKGRAVKIIAQLLADLGEGYDFRVIFMERVLDEVVRSQDEMLERLGKSRAGLSEEILKKVFIAQVAEAKELLAERDVPTLYVSFLDCFKRPAETAAAVNAFLGGVLDEKAMAGVVEPALYRRRGPR